ncbi:jg10948 [Pararge aegeria aegeria]|uniref:Jg10948 protein n=1 Tax=Pararge aegeria aegeria TaxID=348720 RepID=A0A8S4S8J9_9NEOP|nr:jg10948 [Pararge aegeria aegeria]
MLSLITPDWISTALLSAMSEELSAKIIYADPMKVGLAWLKRRILCVLSWSEKHTSLSNKRDKVCDSCLKFVAVAALIIPYVPTFPTQCGDLLPVESPLPFALPFALRALAPL